MIKKYNDFISEELSGEPKYTPMPHIPGPGTSRCNYVDLDEGDIKKYPALQKLIDNKEISMRGNKAYYFKNNKGIKRILTDLDHNPTGWDEEQESVKNEKATIIISKKVDVPEKDIKDAISAIKKWFESNPDKDICRPSMFGHNIWEVNRKSISSDVKDCAKNAMPYSKV